MAKKMITFALLGFMLLCSSKVFASDAAQRHPIEGKDITLVDSTDMRYQKTPLRKLQRGVFNTITCPLEVPASIFNVATDEENDFAGWTLGSVQGVFTAFLRGLEGIFDTVTFLIPPYSKSIMAPEFAWDSLAEAYARHDNFK